MARSLMVASPLEAAHQPGATQRNASSGESAEIEFRFVELYYQVCEPQAAASPSTNRFSMS